MTSSLASFTLNYLSSSFVLRLYGLCFRHYENLGMSDVTNNCFAESENLALARDSGGPKSSHKLHISLDAINNHMENVYLFIKIACACPKTQIPPAFVSNLCLDITLLKIMT